MGMAEHKEKSRKRPQKRAHLIKEFFHFGNARERRRQNEENGDNNNNNRVYTAEK